MREITALMTPEEFTDFKNDVFGLIQKEKEEGRNGDCLRCWLIGYLTASRLEPLAYSPEQLKELFEATFPERTDKDVCASM